MSSLIPNERGTTLTLSQTYHGDDEHEPVTKFKTEMDLYPELWKIAQRIEGLVVRLGIHASGVLVTNETITDSNSIMRTSRGIVVTAFDLHDTEYCGGVKYDFLSVDGIGKIRAAMNLLLRDNLMTWQGSLKETYNHYLLPKNLRYSDQMWQDIADNKVNSLWQLNTTVGKDALSAVKATSLKEIGIINSLMRLQPQNKGDEQPIDTYKKYKDNIEIWYNEMRLFGLNEDEIKLMEKHLLLLNGMADTQESVMVMSMDKDITNFGVIEANLLRKGIAKKKAKKQEEARKLFYEKGLENGTRQEMLDYVWKVQISRQLGYSFSLPHVAAYSMIAIQQANLYTFYPSIYWSTACLSADAGAIVEEDLQDLIDLGYVKPSALDTHKKGKIERGKVAAAISSFQQEALVNGPQINSSGHGFTPNVEDNTIECGLKIVSKLGDDLVNEIIANRPYASLDDFTRKVKISKDRVVMLIKAGAFRNIESLPKLELLKRFVKQTSKPKSRLTLQNFKMLIRNDLVPEEYQMFVKFYLWVDYIRKETKKIDKQMRGYYILDEPAEQYYHLHDFLDNGKLEQRDGHTIVRKAYIDAIYDKNIDIPRQWIKRNQTSLLEELNYKLFQDEWDKYGAFNNAQAEMQSMRIYIDKHELDNSVVDRNITPLSYINSDEIASTFTNKEGKVIPLYKIHHIIGTVIDKNKLKNIVTLLTPDGPINIKFWKDTFTHYDQKVVDIIGGEKRVVQESFFDNGTHLLITGTKLGNTFVPKKYKRNNISDVCIKLDIYKADYTLYETKQK